MDTAEYWADRLITMEDEERHSFLREKSTPYVVEPKTGRLLCFRDAVKDLDGYRSSIGWVMCADRRRRWCTYGSERILVYQEKPRSVFSDFMAAAEDIRDLYAVLDKGAGFLFDGSLYPDPKRYSSSSDDFAHVLRIEGMNSLQVVTSFRGHSKKYDEIITPGCFRKESRSLWKVETTYNLWRKKQTYAANVLKQVIWERYGKPVSDVEAKGLLQHYGLALPTAVTGASADVNVAKWFALNEYYRYPNQYRPKLFREENDRAQGYAEASCVYKIILLYLAQPVSDKDDRLVPGPAVPWNLMELWSKGLTRQRGLGIYGIGPADQDHWGIVLNITEYAYHPRFYPSGWDEIGGPVMTIDGTSFNAFDKTDGLASYFFPPEEEWLKIVLSYIRRRISAMR